MPSQFIFPRRGAFGFTLVELSSVVAIIGVLAAILLPATSSMQRHSRMMRETNAARQIMVAYNLYAAANDGVLLSGYDKNIQEVLLPNGTFLRGEMCSRYPWRLAPYLDGQVEDIFLVNEGKRPTEKLKPESFEYQYRASLHPALGINGYCVGGWDDGSGQGYFASDVVRRAAAAAKPANLIVFASARLREAGAKDEDEVPGHFLLKPPRIWRTKWRATFDRTSPSDSFGNVDLRWNGKAICAFLDGHVEMLGEPEIADMRHWSNTAAENNDSGYVVPR